MTPFITTDPKFCGQSFRVIEKAMLDARAGDYVANQMITAAPAVPDLIAAIIPALYELETRQEMHRKDYERMYDGEAMPASLADDLKQRAGKIAAIRFALANAGVVDVAPADFAVETLKVAA